MREAESADQESTTTEKFSVTLSSRTSRTRGFQLFTICSSAAASKIFFKGYLLGSLFLTYVAVFGFASGVGALSTLSGLIFLGTTSLLITNRRFQESPFSIIFCIFTFLYLSVPTAFILVEGSDYRFGTGLAELPFKQEDYKQSLAWGLLYLTASWIGVWFAIISVKTRRWKVGQSRFPQISLRHVLLLGIAVIVVTALDRIEFSNVYLEGASKDESLLAFLLFFHAYLALAGLILFFRLSEASCCAPKKITATIVAIFIGFSFLVTVSGSKAAILPVMIFLVAYPFSLIKADPGALVAVPSARLIAILAIVALPIFFLVSIQRNLENDVAPNVAALLEAFDHLDAEIVYELPKTVLYRFSQTGTDRLLLVFQSFVVDGFSFDMAQEFVIYLTKNALNLLLPGTPFLDAYAPTSQLYPLVISKEAMDGGMSLSTLMHKFNTQAYTIFGVFTIIFGALAPIVLGLFAYIFILIFNRIDNLLIKLAMVYFSSEALACQGLEVVLANSVHVLVSMWFMYWLLKVPLHRHNQCNLGSGTMTESGGMPPFRIRRWTIS